MAKGKDMRKGIKRAVSDRNLGPGDWNDHRETKPLTEGI